MIPRIEAVTTIAIKQICFVLLPWGARSPSKTRIAGPNAKTSVNGSLASVATHTRTSIDATPQWSRIRPARAKTARSMSATNENRMLAAWWSASRMGAAGENR